MTHLIDASSRLSRLENVQELYDRNLFLQAFQETSDYWNPETKPSDLSVEELVLAIRLAGRLGGLRLARWLSRAATGLHPTHPKVRYFTCHIRPPGWRFFDDLRALQANPELEGAGPETQASWLGYSAVLWASVRDFDRAHRCLERARSWNKKDSWVFSCESDVLAFADRWDEALAAAEAAWEINPGAPYAARSLAGSLLNLRRVREAAERLANAAEQGESYDVALTACWYLCALAETCAGDERKQILGRAQKLADKSTSLAPLADRETHILFARTRLDIAELADDHQAMELWAEKVRSPFHRKVLANLRQNPSGVRIRLPFRHGIQKHNECLPTSIGSAMAAMATPIDADAMAAQLTFGGTAEWAAADWLEEQGFVVRFFVATPEIAVALVKHGFAFVLTLEGDSSAHAVAVVGLDEAAGTVIVHDPGGFRGTEYLLEYLGKDQAPLAPRAMVCVLPERVPLLDQLLPKMEVEAAAAREAYRRAQQLQGPAAAREVVEDLAARQASHPVTRLLQALQELDDGRIGVAQPLFQALLQEFPAAAFVRANLLACSRSLRNTSLMRQTLAGVVERGMLPGVQSQQDWLFPPADYVAEYADLLRFSRETSHKAHALLHDLIKRGPTYAPAWHVLADLLWDERDTEGALLAYRIAASLADRNEHYARAYSDALGRVGRGDEGLAWLESRARKFGSAFLGESVWVTWIGALETAGRPERALAAAQDALSFHQGSADLLSFLGPFYARMGRWSEAETMLAQLQQTGNTALFHQASARILGTRGELERALEHAQAWLDEMPLSMTARDEVVNLVARREGTKPAMERARSWLELHPAHEDLEELYCRQLNRVGFSSWKKYSVLLRRVKRNPEDGWAWCELAFCAIYDYERLGARSRQRLEPRIMRFLRECDRTSPGEASTLRAHAEWGEARGEWQQSVEEWLAAFAHDPANLYACRHAWEAAARIDNAGRLAVWSRIEALVLRQPGHSPVAREMLLLAAQGFGVSFAEEAAARWVQERPDDPQVAEARVDLLLEHGHGRTDYERALEFLLPELERFPYQLGLRVSHASCLRKLSRHAEANQVLREIVRRHPDHSWSQVQLAWVHQQQHETGQALRLLETAAAQDPQNTRIVQTRAEILMEAQRFAEARATIHDGLKRFPAEVGWRATAIRLLFDCGDEEAAVAAARDGVVEYPRGAYLWLVLGRTLSDHPRFAAQGEIESCLRRSLALNQGLFDAADYLVMLLAEQRRYAEAEQILLEIEPRMPDPSRARGRLAWVRRQKGQKRAAVEDMMSLVRLAPWYDWGWGMLLEWLAEDRSWDHARDVLAEVVPEQRTNTRMRQKRLELLAKAGAARDQLDAEWGSLLHDFPEDASLHLLRYDALRGAERWQEAADVLQRIRAVFPDSPYVIARHVEVLARDGKKAEAVSELMRLFFAEAETSRWPADYAWKAIKSAGCREEAYQKASSLLQQGQILSTTSAGLLADYVMERGKSAKLPAQPLLKILLPDPGARELLKLLNVADSHGQEDHRAIFLDRLSDFGYSRLVIRYWKKHPALVESDIRSWAEVARAFTALKKYREGRQFMASWRQHKGVSMWVVANYLLCHPGLSRKQLLEVRSSCRDALAGLPHDYCARYLCYREAEACALLGDVEGFRETWKRYQEYFDGKLENHEWFEAERKYLLADIAILARYLENGDHREYRRTLRGLRRERRPFRLQAPSSQLSANSGPSTVGWWWIIWFLIVVLSQLGRCVR